MSEIKNIKLNGTKLPIGGTSGGGSKFFEDVTEIPSSPSTETIYRIKAINKPVPNDGSTIGTIYFNTKLTIDEVVEKVNSYDIPWIDGTAFGAPELELYPICMFDGSSFELFNNDPYVALIFARDKEDHSAVIITFACFATGRFVDIFLAKLFGWKGITSQAINLNGITNFQGLTMGTHNALITDLVSSNDFDQKTKYYNYDGTKLNNINTKEEYVIEFEYDKNKYKDDEEFNKQVIEPYQLPINILYQFPNEIDIIIRIKYINNNINGYTIYEDYKVRAYDIITTDGTAYILKFIYPDAHQVKRIELGVVFYGNGIGYLNGFYTDSIGSSVTVDTAMSDSSTNPVQNKVIKEYIDNAIAGQSLTAGEGIKIVNGVISLTYANGDEEEF